MKKGGKIGKNKKKTKKEKLTKNKVNLKNIFKNEKKKVIKNLDTIKVDDNQQIFHAGTTRDKDGKILATGGRVLNSTVLSKSLSVARKKANEILENVKWENKYYRKDIGFRVIDK